MDVNKHLEAEDQEERKTFVEPTLEDHDTLPAITAVISLPPLDDPN